jgi:acetylornithine deacetylase/succinyl-diaminopimelate desuccinylase-like protein
MKAATQQRSLRTAWDSFEREAMDNVRALIRFETVNPPGNERVVTDFLAAALGAEGIGAVVLEKEPARANLVTRLRGGGEAPLMLSSHTDVVGVEPHRWSRPPFGAELAEGCIWGRGAIDMKAKCAMDLVLVLALWRAGVELNRDLIFAAVADEEAGSELGAKFLVERHSDLVRAGWVLNEAGGFTLHLNGRRFYPIQVAEKGYVTVRMVVSAAPGHGSIPRSDTAIAWLADLILRLQRTPMRQRLTPLMRRALADLSVDPQGAPPLFRAMMANTVTPTILRAGYKDNVIPGEASVVLDGRTLPGETPESFVRELRDIVGPEPVLEIIKSAPPAESSSDTLLFRLIARSTEAADPGARAVAWMLPGATDSKFYAQLGATCYGFAPVKIGAGTPYGSLYHANDERIPVDGFLWGLRLYTEVVLTLLGLKFDEVFC